MSYSVEGLEDIQGNYLAGEFQRLVSGIGDIYQKIRSRSLKDMVKALICWHVPFDGTSLIVKISALLAVFETKHFFLFKYKEGE